MNSTRNPIALVTGGRRGIGAAIARAMARRGFDIVLSDLERDADADAVLKAVKTAGRRAEFAAADIADLATHDALVGRAWAAFGAIDCLVNNAGVQVQVRGDLLDTTAASFDRVLGVNLRGTFFLTQAVARRMAGEARNPADPHRSIVTISSINAVKASTNRGEYCISKAGLTMLNKLFALRLAPHGIHCYEVRPGAVRTSMTAPVKDTYEQFIAEGGVPVARWAEPEDVAGAVATLASGDMPFSTGDSFAIDGGLHVEKL